MSARGERGAVAVAVVALLLALALVAGAGLEAGRSLVVDESTRGRGFGSRIVEELNRWAVQEGFSTLCAFTHNAAHFVRLGFSIVPHPWLPEKIATDCVGCPKFRQCTQYAMALPLRGRSLRTSPAGQRPYLAMPETVTPIVPHQGRTIGVDGPHDA